MTKNVCVYRKRSRKHSKGGIRRCWQLDITSLAVNPGSGFVAWYPTLAGLLKSKLENVDHVQWTTEVMDIRQLKVAKLRQNM